MSGLTPEEKIREFQKFDLLERFRQRMQNSPEGKAYHDSLMKVTCMLKKALDLNDYESMFDLEYEFVKTNAERFKQQKVTEMLVVIADLKQRFIDFKDPDNVQGKFAYAMQNSSGKAITDDNFRRPISALIRNLKKCVGLRSPACEVDFYGARQACLKAILKEHNKNVARALYPEKAQQK